MLFNAQGGSISVGKALNHASLAGRNEILQSIAELKGQAQTSSATPAAIIQKTRKKVNINYAAKMPSTLAMRHTIHRRMVVMVWSFLLFEKVLNISQ